MSAEMENVMAAVLGLCSALITGLLLPWLKTRLGEAKLRQLKACAEIAVAAAEQLFGPGEGESKLGFAESYLIGCGLPADRAAIEAAVYELPKGGEAE